MVVRSTAERWLVTGACGQLGGYLIRDLQADRSRETPAILGVGRRACRHGSVEVAEIDLNETSQVLDVLASYRPTHVVHLGEVSSLRVSATDALARNLATTQAIAAYAQRAQAWFFYASTDFVWDGSSRSPYREADPPSPISDYARSKVAGERAAFGGAVGRISLLYGFPCCPRETTFTSLVDCLVEGDCIDACADEIRTPIWLHDASRAILRLGRVAYRGLVHIGGPQAMTPMEMVEGYARHLGVTPEIRVISRVQLAGGAGRPQQAALDSSLLGSVLPGWMALPFDEACGRLFDVPRVAAAQVT
jgi:dTDP-4-dehydrorhamnose reductase